MKKLILRLGILTSMCLGTILSSTPASAVLNDFDPGNIMDDAVATNYGSMSADQIQSFLNSKVPEVLLSGNHQNIEKWRRQKSLENTYKKRPELLKNKKLSLEDKEFLCKFK